MASTNTLHTYIMDTLANEFPQSRHDHPQYTVTLCYADDSVRAFNFTNRAEIWRYLDSQDLRSVQIRGWDYLRVFRCDGR